MQGDIYQRQLGGLAEVGRLRRLSPRTGIDFSSNDYLGLAGDPLIAAAVVEAIAAGVPVGSGGSRLLRGNAPEHEALEAKAAAFFGTEAALFFSSGYAANLALYSTLPQKGDLVVADASSMPAHTTDFDGRGQAMSSPRITTSNPSPTRSLNGVGRAAPDACGSPSRRFIRWMATGRQSTSLPSSPGCTMPGC